MENIDIQIIDIPNYCSIDMTNGLVYSRGSNSPVDLPDHLRRLFEFLYKNKNSYVSNTKLGKISKDPDFPLLEKSVTTYISQLRNIIGDTTKPYSVIKNKKSFGYMLEMPEKSQSNDSDSKYETGLNYNRIREEVINPVINRLLSEKNNDLKLPKLEIKAPFVEPVEVTDNNENYLIAEVNGKRKKYDIYFTFTSPKTKKGYIAYTDHSHSSDGKEILNIGVYNPDKGFIELETVESAEEWNMINRVIDQLKNNADYIIEIKHPNEKKSQYFEVDNREILYTKSLSQDEILNYLIKKVTQYDAFSIMNLALLLTNNKRMTDEDWMTIDNILKLLRNTDKSNIEDIYVWAEQKANSDDIYGYLTHYLLLREGIIKYSSLGSKEYLIGVLNYNGVTPSYTPPN